MKTYGKVGQRGWAVMAAAIVAVGGLQAIAFGANGTWTQAGAAPPYNWGDAANWQSGVIADGIGSTATFNTAGLTVPMMVNLDVDRTIGNMTFSNPTNALGWTITNGNLTLATS